MTAANSARPQRQVCVLCGHDDEVKVHDIGTHWVYECRGGRAHQQPHTWPVPKPPATAPKVTSAAAGNEGVMKRSGLFDALPQCLEAGEGWIEHAVVEHRLKERFPEVYFPLLEEYPNRTENRAETKTISRLIGGALEKLERHGVVVQRKGPGTGCSSHLDFCGYWSLPPAPTGASSTSWADYATEHGLDPEVWVLGDAA